MPHARILSALPHASQGHLLCFGAVSCTKSGGGREREDRPARKKRLRRARAQGSAVLKAKSAAAALSVRVRPFVLPHAYVPRETKWALYITDYSSCSDTHYNGAASDYSFWDTF